MKKRNLPLAKVYALLETGPVVLVSTASDGEIDVMTQSWHLPMEFEPPLIGMIVSDRNHSFGLLIASGECVINIPTSRQLKAVVGCGNMSGRRVDKFGKFGLTRDEGSAVGAPLIRECYANLECRVVDASLVEKYGFFVVEVVKAWVDPAIKEPKTLHHRGRGRFMIAGRTVQTTSKMR